MTTRLPITLLTLAALAFTPACKKDTVTETPDTTTGGEPGDSGGEEGDPVEEALPPLPEQDPDPTEIAALYTRYLEGDYEAVGTEAQALADSSTEDTQVRAQGLALALTALAAVEHVPEQGQDNAELAIQNGLRLHDQALTQLASIAHGLYLIRVHEAEAGQTEIEAVLDGPYTGLAHIALAEAHLNQAYGLGSEGEEIVVAPARFDDARAEYEAALADGSGLIQAQAHEGLAAVAKYKGEKDVVCQHAQEAENLFAANNATEGLREVPQLLAKSARCKDFVKAE